MNLSGLTIGSLELTPTFDKNVTEYTATTENATNKVTATAESESAEIKIEVNGVEIDNESSASWNEGENEVIITVTNGANSKEYSVTVVRPYTLAFSPSGLTANETDGLSAESVSITNEGATITSVTADNENITVSEAEGVISVTCEDESVLTNDNLPITVTVIGTIDGIYASGNFQITYS